MQSVRKVKGLDMFANFVNTVLGLPTPWDQLTGFQQSMVMVLLAFWAWVLFMVGLFVWRWIESWRLRRRLISSQQFMKREWPLP